MAKNAEYDSAWCADHEKVYINPFENQVLRSKFFRHKFRWKKFLKYWKLELAKNAKCDSAFSANHEKVYIKPLKINFKKYRS